MPRPRLLVERWFPVHEVGTEVARERAGANMLPPLYFLHIWWARRPAIATRALFVLSCLPDYALEELGKDTILQMIGILGDPIKARLEGKFNYPVAESQNPTTSTYRPYMLKVWGREPTFADMMAGGGVAPFEAVRSGFGLVVAGEYNPIAYVILKAAVEYPLRYGRKLVDDVKKWGNQLLRELREKVKQYYPPHKMGQPTGYIWVRVFRCPKCGKEIPALKDLWLDRKKGYALYPVWDENGEVRFHVVRVVVKGREKRGEEEIVKVVVREGPLMGTEFNVARKFEEGGKLVCPDGHVMGKDEVKEYYRTYMEKREAEGYRGVHPAKLAAVVFKGRRYTEPAAEMVEAYKRAEEDLKALWDDLIAENLVPLESREKGPSDRVVIYGLNTFYRLFNARQLLVHAEIVRLIREIYDKLRGTVDDPDYAKAIITYLTLAFGKTLDYNSAITSWDKSQGSIRDTFDTHAYAWTWDFGEFDMIEETKSGFKWAFDNVLKALQGLVNRIKNLGASVITILGDAEFTTLEHRPEGGFDVIFIDPPYYDNVQYAELSDFFYVWFKLVLRDVYPEAFSLPLTPKDEEAVKNDVRHGGRDRAARFYEEKMLRIFKSSYEALRDDGILLLWFAHKAGEAWIRTIRSLLDAGFTISAVWSLRSEMERSLHISGKAALRSSLIFVCRKREREEGGWLPDLMRDFEPAVAKRVEELEEMGFFGPDLIMGAIGEGLRLVSELWPVKDPEGKLTPPEILGKVIDKASTIAINHIMRKVPRLELLDIPTRFYALACYIYKGVMEYDDARRLALSLGVVGEDPVKEIAVDTGLARLTVTTVQKTRAKVVELLGPVEREKAGLITGQYAIDHIHAAMAVLAKQGSAEEAAKHIAALGPAATEIVKVFYEAMRELDKLGMLGDKKKKMPKPGELMKIILYRICERKLHEAVEIKEVKTQKTLEEFVG